MESRGKPVMKILWNDKMRIMDKGSPRTDFILRGVECNALKVHIRQNDTVFGMYPRYVRVYGQLCGDMMSWPVFPCMV